MKETKDVTLLIVDDEEDLRKAIVFDFKRKGFVVLEAPNGKLAFEIIQKQKVDVVISDVQMPGGNGIELLDRIKEYNTAIPVVMFITGFAEITIEDAYNKGVEAVFSKPFDRKALLSAVLKVTVDKENLWNGRKSERIDVSCDIEFSFASLNQAIHGKVLKIGRGGLFIAMESSFPEVGQEVQFKIKFLEGSLQHIQGSGIVRWVRSQSCEKYPTGCGIEFFYLDDESRSGVINLINSVKTMSFIPNG